MTRSTTTQQEEMIMCDCGCRQDDYDLGVWTDAEYAAYLDRQAAAWEAQGNADLPPATDEPTEVDDEPADDLDDEPYDDYDFEPLERAYCDSYEVHAEHSYVALNRNVYLCCGLTAEDQAAIEAEAAAPPCEHGLSASLCGGPEHWYDNDLDRY